ncbi:MAG: NAD(P)-binding domain-containing protein [Chlorobi bacterium]|nr:NAD(P)-binding domain-containing protein [Chlorobiota bacterium]
MKKLRILANDGLAPSAKEKLEKAGHIVYDRKIPQEELADFINENDIDVLVVRSATKVPASLLKKVEPLKMIVRAGVGLDNIDTAYAKEKGIRVENTPEASSRSVAELVMAHLLGGARFLHESNREMPLRGDTDFKDLKKQYSAGREVRGKTIGILGMGRIGREVAKLATGLGMKVKAYDPYVEEASYTLDFFDGQQAHFTVRTEPKEEVLREADFVTLHVPAQDKPVIGKKELEMMKEGAALINAARGGVVDEAELLKALDSGKLSFAALDVYESEPAPPIKLLMHPKVSLTPHIGASTLEAQERIGEEIVKKIHELAAQSG